MALVVRGVRATGQALAATAAPPPMVKGDQVAVLDDLRGLVITGEGQGLEDAGGDLRRRRPGPRRWRRCWSPAAAGGWLVVAGDFRPVRCRRRRRRRPGAAESPLSVTGGWPGSGVGSAEGSAPGVGSAGTGRVVRRSRSASASPRLVSGLHHRWSCCRWPAGRRRGQLSTTRTAAFSDAELDAPCDHPTPARAMMCLPGADRQEPGHDLEQLAVRADEGVAGAGRQRTRVRSRIRGASASMCSRATVRRRTCSALGRAAWLRQVRNALPTRPSRLQARSASRPAVIAVMPAQVIQRRTPPRWSRASNKPHAL